MEDRKKLSNKRLDKKVINCIAIDRPCNNPRPSIKHDYNTYNRIHTEPHGSMEVREKSRYSMQRYNSKVRLNYDLETNENNDLSTTLKKNNFIDNSCENTVLSPTRTIKNLIPYENNSIKKKISETIKSSVCDSLNYLPKRKIFDVNALYQGNLRES